NKKIPLVLIPKNITTKELTELVEFLGVKKVYALFGSRIIIENVSIEGLDEKHVEEENLKAVRRKPLVIAAVANWQDGIATRATPHGTAILVFSENEIPSLIEKVKNLLLTQNISRILIVGKPDLARKIYEALLNEGIDSDKLVFVAGSHYEVAKKIGRAIREEIREIKKKLEILPIKVKSVKLLKEKCFELGEKANDTLTNLDIEDPLVAKRSDLILELVNRCTIEREPKKLLAIVNDLDNQLKALKWIHKKVDEEVAEETLDKEKVFEVVARIRKVSVEAAKKVEECKENLREGLVEIEEEKNREMAIRKLSEKVRGCTEEVVREFVTKIPHTAVSPLTKVVIEKVVSQVPTISVKE
ncbi:MAG: hypothetical protein RMJ17_03320, partial [Candidatus Aenigmarchaeota archaeon]|nr:hypothetical protein [Candidatus Aenigmarchaeota archaeon]MDW8149596.1 hypothetical protein [Candidatus Aenigmarchaeota archaeon]